ncbi:hypothetical protein V1478_005308 [Vespula squamosa]|uniref:Uncharacterized protein n=1 Tax=Vespula squamosa TaxID=30214 RepID=A0ABD2BDT9_VESSQ
MGEEKVKCYSSLVITYAILFTIHGTNSPNSNRTLYELYEVLLSAFTFCNFHIFKYPESPKLSSKASINCIDISLDQIKEITEDIFSKLKKERTLRTLKKKDK